MSKETKQPYERISTHYYDDEEDSMIINDDEEREELGRLPPTQRREQLSAERLSMRLLAIPDEDEDEHDRVLRKSLKLAAEDLPRSQSVRDSAIVRVSSRFDADEDSLEASLKLKARRNVWIMIVVLTIAGFLVVFSILVFLGYQAVGPPNQPSGPYVLIERQEGTEFFNFYNFYKGRDSIGSNGYNMYVSQDQADALKIVNVTMEEDILDVYAEERSGKSSTNKATKKPEPFVYMGSSPTVEGPRDSIRLEGIRRFNRGLFIIDIRHMPVGCGVWPAFWLTDEANWPVNGEIDIVEGVNYQSEAKTALHSTKTCVMDDVPLGTMTGTWDTSQGIPDAKTGIPDMKLREARNCFVYDPHQWLNQGCVAIDAKGGSLGRPLNAKGGGVFVLEWDPMYRHIRTWVFSPHENVPENLVDAIRTSNDPTPIAPDPDSWSLPYGYFPIGSATNCPAFHFKHMRLVFNTAFCGSVAGNRFHLDCPQQVAANYSTCNEWIKSEPRELEEAYWKVRGVYVYEREWERNWSV